MMMWTVKMIETYDIIFFSFCFSTV
jgi:hypothetical protein